MRSMKWLILNANTEINETNEMTGIDGVDNIDEIDDISDICQDWLNQNKCQCRYCDTLCSKYSMSLSTGKNHQINYTKIAWIAWSKSPSHLTHPSLGKLSLKTCVATPVSDDLHTWISPKKGDIAKRPGKGSVFFTTAPPVLYRMTPQRLRKNRVKVKKISPKPAWYRTTEALFNSVSFKESSH